MRLPTERKKIYQKLKNMVLSMPKGESLRLPTERELAAQFGCARITVRNALKLLGEDFPITSIPSKGTFVTDRASGTKTVSMLIPCAGHLLYTLSYEIVASNIFAAYYGIMRATASKGFNAALIPFSETNKIDKPDMTQLEKLSHNSLLYIPGADWYHDYFTFFDSIGCRIVAGGTSDELMMYSDKWHIQVPDTRETIGNAVRRLRNTGCGKIVFVSDFPPIASIAEAFSDAGEDTSESSFITLDENIPHEKQIRKHWDELRFDGMIYQPSIFPRVNMHEQLTVNLRLPPYVKILILDDWKTNRDMLSPCGVFKYDRRKLGMLAAELLMSKKFTPGISCHEADYLSPDQLKSEAGEYPEL